MFSLPEDITILLNPDTMAFCVSSDKTNELLENFYVSKGESGEKIHHIPSQKIKKPGELKDVFSALRVGNLVADRKIKLLNPKEIKKSCKKRIIPDSDITIIPYAGCNLRCSYCWNTHGTYAAPGSSASVMSQDTIKQTARWLVDIIKSGSAKNRINKIGFFGGEPLFGTDAFLTIVKAVRKAEKQNTKKIEILLDTNGTLLNDELILFCKHHEVKIGVSLDGPEQLHDSARVDASGRGTHALVVDVIKKIQAVCPNLLVIRSTAALQSDMLAINDYMHDMGFSDFSSVLVGNVRIGAQCGEIFSDYNLAHCREKRYEFIKTYIGRLVSRENLYFLPDFFGMVTNGLSHKPRFYICNLGLGGFSILPDGAIVSCYLFAFDRSRKIGNVFDGIDYEAVARQKNFARSHPVWAYEECRKCFARYKCGGPCYAHNLAFTGDMAKFSNKACQRAREEYIMEMYATTLLAKKDPAFFKKFQENNSKKEGRKDIRKLFEEYYVRKEAN